MREIKQNGVRRHNLGLVLDEEVTPLQSSHRYWYPIMVDGQKIGDMTNGVFSRKLQRNIGFALVANRYQNGDRVEVHKDNQVLGGTLTNLPFSN